MISIREIWLEPRLREVWVAAAYPFGLGVDELLAYDLDGRLKRHGPAPSEIILSPVLPLDKELLRPLAGMKPAPDDEVGIWTR